MNQITNETAITLPTLQDNATSLGVSVGDLETFRPYDSALPVPALKGYRTVKCLYKKNPKTGKSLAENSYIRVADYISEDLVLSKITSLASIVVGYLQGEEDKLIKQYHVDGASQVSEKDLTIDAIIEAIESSSVSQRLNKEKIEDWYQMEMVDDLTVLFSDKLSIDIDNEPTENELEKLQIVLNAYKGKFVGLASGKTHYKEPDIKAMIEVMDVTGAKDTFIGGRFSVRLEKMLITDSDSLLMSL